MANVLSREDQLHVLRLLVECNTLRSITRITGVHRTTVANLMVRFGAACRELLDDQMRGLTLNHLQVDEVWTFVGKKQARLTLEERATRHDVGDVYLWTVLDTETKLIPTFAVGKRSADNARKLMMDLAGRLERPLPHQSDSHGFQRGAFPLTCQLSTDGFAGYPEAVDLAFGPYVKYGQIIKEYRNAVLPYTPSEIVGTQRRPIFRMAENERFSICTSHVERNNLTLRTFLKRFARLSLGFSKKLENLAAAISMYVAYYNYVWRTRHDDDSGQAGRLRPTAAMMAGVTDHLWTFEELYSRAMES
jgi:IS1 family transposase